MHTSDPVIEQALISQPDVCKKIGQSRSGLARLRQIDPSFPKPIKFSDSRQASSYYVVAEIDAWIAAKIQARDAA